MVSQDGDSKLVKAFIDRASKLLDEMNKFTQAPSTLKEYSQWMSSFQASHYDEQLEMPGSTEPNCCRFCPFLYYSLFRI